MDPIETLTCRAFAADVAAYEAAHPGQPRIEMPAYAELVAAVQARTGTTGNERELSGALDDTLIDCKATPEARLLDVLAHHRTVADRWRA